MVLDDMRTEIYELKAKMDELQACIVTLSEHDNFQKAEIKKLEKAIAKEREACAKVIEDTKAHNFTLQQLANKIRARK